MNDITRSRRAFLYAAGKFAVLGLGAAPALSALFSGCSAVGPAVGSLGDIGSKMESAMKIGKAVAKGFEDITPEQEYYIGRTVGAMILAKYKPYNNDGANQYINVLGQTLAQASDLPETYGGYHFQIQDSDEINALAAPGGLIFVTRGILRCCKHEDAVAAVLAHEIGHVQFRHGLQAINKSRITSALSTIAIEGTKQFGSSTLASLTETFEDSITDITSTLINNGYSRSFEREADKAAVTIMQRVGYNPRGLLDMLETMQTELKPGGLDFAKTHPSPESRIKDIRKQTGEMEKVDAPKARQDRYKKALAKV
jgi:predicted Zn-dependent protease